MLLLTIHLILVHHHVLWFVELLGLLHLILTYYGRPSSDILTRILLKELCEDVDLFKTLSTREATESQIAFWHLRFIIDFIDSQFDCAHFIVVECKLADVRIVV